MALRRIQGSEGRCRDFDRGFAPLQDHTRERWLSVAVAWLQGHDGHHRISVARALGCVDIDASVTVWEAAGPLPWARQQLAAGAPFGISETSLY